MKSEKNSLKWLITEMLEKGEGRKTILNYGKDWGGWIELEGKANVGKISEQYGKLGIKSIDFWDEKFPKNLREIADPPVVIYYQGRLPKKNEVWVAVIGSRKVSPEGERWVKKIVPELVKEGVGIVSGLALGVDGLVHEECLRAGGRTVAVLPVGLERVYPLRHKGLVERILKQGGGVVSEYPVGSELKRSNFLERNRLVSGLSRGVVVIEAARRSGSISTPNFAVDQGKEVWCVKKKRGEVNSEGLLDLVADGARVIESGDEIIKGIKLH